MESKRVETIIVKINDDRWTIVQESKVRVFLAEQSNKFHNLLKKYKIVKEKKNV